MAVTNTPDKSEMLPCPFSHEVKRGVFVEVDTVDFGFARVSCSDCGCAGPYVTLANHERATKAEKAEAIAAWNTRSRPPADQVPDRDGLAESLKARLASRYNATRNTIPVSRTEVERIIAALKAVPAASEVGWQPIETIPPASTNLIVWDSDFNRPVVVQTNNDGEPWGGDWDYHITKASHWMLPEPPALKATGEE